MTRIQLDQQRTLREEAAEMVNENEKFSDPMSPENITEHDPTAVNRDQDNPEIVEEGQAVPQAQRHKKSTRRKE